MNRRLLLVPAAALLLAAPLAAAGRPEDPLAYVPESAVSVGMVRVADLRTSPITARLFAETDKITVDGDATRFMEETGLRPKEDVDTIVFAATPSAGDKGGALAVFEGRFDKDRLAAAVSSRGAQRKGAGDAEYFLLADKEGRSHDQGAVAFLNRHLVVAGSEDAVVRALGQRDNGGTRFRAGAGLGRYLSRIDTDATAWAIVDAARMSSSPKPRRDSEVRVRGDVDGQPVNIMLGAFRELQLVTLQATAKSDSLKLVATGLSESEETRENISDALKGIMAAWRMAAQEKSPDTVALLRKFKVSTDRDGVTLSGTLPGAAVRAMLEKSDRSKVTE